MPRHSQTIQGSGNIVQSSPELPQENSACHCPHSTDLAEVKKHYRASEFLSQPRELIAKKQQAQGALQGPAPTQKQTKKQHLRCSQSRPRLAPNQPAMCS